VAVVGAGIIGLSIAWHLARRGDLQIAVYDGAGIGAGATAIQPGGVRQQWATPIACRLARESYRFYRDLEATLGLAVGSKLDACGYIFLAESEEALAQLARRVSMQNELGIPSRIVTPADAGELVPGLNPEPIAGASYCGEDGYFDRPQAVVAAFADACRHAGVQFEQAHVHTVEPDGGGWSVELADERALTFDSVVVAASYDTPAVLNRHAAELPIEREPRYLFYSNPIRERLLEPLVISPERHFAAKQLADGSVLASDLSADGDPVTDKSSWHTHIRTTITALVPILEYVSFPVLVDGYYDVTPDHQPIVGPLDAGASLWVASGLNGRGFMMAPAVGRIVAEGIRDGAPPGDLAELAAERFGRGGLVPESQVV
jgi:sarcosine oxidase subunit beta